MAEKNEEDTAWSGTARGYFGIWAATIPMVTVCVVTLSANGAILFMFASRRGLRRCKNLYFFSLAMADFLAGLCMPYKITRDLHYTWDTGWNCKLYQTFHQSLKYASFLSIFLITWDKWRAVHYPVSYKSKSTKSIAIGAVLFIWITSFCVFTLPHIWWDNLVISRPLTSQLTSTGSGVNVTPYDNINLENQDSNSSINVQYHIKKGLTRHHFVMCPDGYHLNIKLSIFSTTFFFVLPLVIILIFDISLYFKIKLRKSVEVQRSTSVTDTYFLTLKKPALDLPESCMAASSDNDCGKESLIRNSDNKLINKHLAIAGRGERRHSSLPAISPTIQGRTSSGRRVSMPESNSGGGCRYVGRKWSGCATVLGNNPNQIPNPVANLAPRIHNDDMVHDILVKQDKITANCVCLMLVVFVICWLPVTVVTTINSRCWCFFGVATTTTWFLNLDHAINPFLYGLMYVQFQNVIKQWLLTERVHAFKMRDTLILKSIENRINCEEINRQRSPNPQTKHYQFIVPETTPRFDSTGQEVDNTQL